METVLKDTTSVWERMLIGNTLYYEKEIISLYFILLKPLFMYRTLIFDAEKMNLIIANSESYMLEWDILNMKCPSLRTLWHAQQKRGFEVKSVISYNVTFLKIRW